MTDMLKHALDYVREGWAVFPCLPDDKRPACPHGHLEATINPDKIRAWWEENPNYNIGTVPASMSLVAVDYDTKHGKTVEELQAEMPAEPLEPRMVVTTPSGGEHHYYWSEEDIPSTVGKLAPNVDTRGADGYTLLPPSQVKGKPYTWVRRDKPSAFKNDLREHIKRVHRKSKKDADRDTWIIPADMPEHIEEAILYLHDKHPDPRYRCRPAIETQGGDETTYATACMMVSFGISEDLAFELMLEHYNERCIPTWDPEDLHVKVANAYEHHGSQFGNITKAYRVKKAEMRRQGLFLPHEKPEELAPETGALYKTKAIPSFRITTRDRADHIPDPQYLVPNILHKDTTAILAGQWGSYKTFVALDLLCHVAAPDTAQKLHWSVEDPGPVCLIAGEGRSGLKKRLTAWEDYHNTRIPDKDLIIVDPALHVTNPHEAIDELIGYLMLLNPRGYSLTVIDTLTLLTLGMNENASETAGAALLLLNLLRTELKTTVLALAHTAKMTDHKQAITTRGSGVIEASADTVLTLQAHNQHATLATTKQKDGPVSDPISLRLLSHQDSLVPIITESRDAHTSPPTPKVDFKANHEKATRLKMIEDAALKILRRTPTSAEGYTTSGLAKTVLKEVGQSNLGIELRTVQSYLGELGLNDLSPLSNAFTPSKGNGAGDKWSHIGGLR